MYGQLAYWSQSFNLPNFIKNKNTFCKALNSESDYFANSVRVTEGIFITQARGIYRIFFYCIFLFCDVWFSLKLQSLPVNPFLYCLCIRLIQNETDGQTGPPAVLSNFLFLFTNIKEASF